MPRKLPQLITVKSDAVIKMFFDFYVLNEIWFKLVAKDVIYGYKTDTIIPFRRESVLNEAFLEICEKLKFLMVNSLEWSVRRECRHFNIYGPLGTLISRKSLKKLMIKAISHNDQKDIKKIKEEINARKQHNSFIKKNKPWSKCSLEAIREAFMMEGWDSEFGGVKWGEGTNYLIKLKESKSIKDDIFYIDRIFDLQHNNGFILNKTCFEALENLCLIDLNPKIKTIHSHVDDYCLLDARFELSIEILSSFCSPKVKKLYQSNKHLLQGNFEKYYIGEKINTR